VCVGDTVAEYTKDKRFSLGWVIGGTLIMFLTNIFGGIAVAAMGSIGVYELLAIAIACFALGGFVIGWQSEGSTILEAGLAAAIATGLTVAYRASVLVLDPVSLMIGLGIPFVAGIIGGWIGEKVQGDVIKTED
jgi:hypothetical protein